MRIAISGIAWEPAEDDAIAALLWRHSVDAIDVAPMKYFPDPRAASGSEIEAVRRWWSDRGISIIGMQALLFGAGPYNLFGGVDDRAHLLEHLGAVCRIGSLLAADRLVFGSPRHRDRSGLEDSVAGAMAVDFFRRLGDIAARHGVRVCLEPVNARYNCNFLTDSASTAEMVTRIGHPAIAMQIDTGTIHDNGENLTAVLAAHHSLVGHVHASEPGLLPLGDGVCDHAGAGRALALHVGEMPVCVEMLTTTGEPHALSIERALMVAIRHYRCEVPPGTRVAPNPK